VKRWPLVRPGARRAAPATYKTTQKPRRTDAGPRRARRAPFCSRSGEKSTERFQNVEVGRGGTGTSCNSACVSGRQGAGAQLGLHYINGKLINKGRSVTSNIPRIVDLRADGRRDTLRLIGADYRCSRRRVGDKYHSGCFRRELMGQRVSTCSTPPKSLRAPGVSTRCTSGRWKDNPNGRVL